MSVDLLFTIYHLRFTDYVLVQNIGEVFAVLLLLTVQQGDIGPDIQQAIKNEKLGSPEFKRSVSQVLAKYGVQGGKFQAQHTIGDKRGLMLTAHSETADANKYPIWWRIYIWPDGSQNRAQLIKKAELYLEGGTFTEGEVFWRDDRLVIAGSEVNGGNGELAALTSYRMASGKWKTLQHIEDKREGFAKFSRNDKSVDPSRVRVITRDWTKHLKQPHVGPLLKFESAWLLVGGSYRQGQTAMVYTPLAEMETLAGFVEDNDSASFKRRVPNGIRAKLWDNLKKYMAVQSPSGNVYDTVDSFQFGDNGPIVTMRKVGSRWVPSHWKD
jgi:hypothetical protein